MNKLTIIFIATLALGVSCLPPRVKRQFDWDNFNAPDQYWDPNNANTIRIPRQRAPESWERRNPGSNSNWNQPSGRQFPQNVNNGNQGLNNPSDTDFGNDFNNPSDTDFSNIFNQGLDNGGSSTVSPVSDGTTRASAAYMTCMRACQYTKEYNPVCGSDSNNYNNRQELECARSCGRNIRLVRGGTCTPL